MKRALKFMTFVMCCIGLTGCGKPPKGVARGILIKKLLICIIICLLPISVYAETAKDVFKALKKLEARCQTGISYNDFSSALGESKYTLNQ